MTEPAWDLYQSLHAVLQTGSLSSAARRRGLTQPTLGRHIEALEQQLGAPLFLRSPRGLTPTDLAVGLGAHLDEMAAAAAAALRDASGTADGHKGVVRLTVSEVVGTEVMPDVLTGFRRKHPDIDIELVLANHNEDLSRREADIAVRMARPTQNSLVARKVGVFEFGFYATPDYLDRCGVPQTLDDLNNHTVIGYDRREISVPGGLDIGRPITRDIFALRTDNDVAQLAALKAGFGIGVCQHRVGRSAGLVHVLPGQFSFELETWIAMHENLKGVRRMRLMFDHLVETLTKACAESRG